MVNDLRRAHEKELSLQQATIKSLKEQLFLAQSEAKDSKREAEKQVQLLMGRYILEQKEKRDAFNIFNLTLGNDTIKMLGLFLGLTLLLFFMKLF